MKKIVQFKKAKYKVDNKDYSINDLTICDNQNLIVINGPSGNGKSLFINFVFDLYKPTNGVAHSYLVSDKVVFINHENRGIDRLPLITNVRLLFENIYKFNCRMIEDYLYIRLGVSKKLDVKFSDLSSYDQKKLNIMPLFCNDIINKYNFFVIDEIFVGLDDETKETLLYKVTDLVNSNKVVILIEQDMSILEKIVKSARNVDNIIISNNGNINYEVIID